MNGHPASPTPIAGTPFLLQDSEAPTETPIAVLPKEKKPRALKESSEATGARSDARGDSLFFPLLLATKKTLETESRAARISNLSIVQSMIMQSNNRVGKLTNTFFEQRRNIAASIDGRKSFIESAYLNQMKGEREMIPSRIERMTCGLRKSFLEKSLHQLNQELNNKQR